MPALIAIMPLLNFPHLRQNFPYDCGAECAQGILAYYGFDVPEGKVMKIAGTSSVGTSPRGICRVLKKSGLKAQFQALTIADVKDNLDQGRPVILAIQGWAGKKVSDWSKIWNHCHYVVAIGYDKRRFIFADPYIFHRTYLTFDELGPRWRDKNIKGEKFFNHGIVISGARPNYNPDKIVHLD